MDFVDVLDSGFVVFDSIILIHFMCSGIFFSGLSMGGSVDIFQERGLWIRSVPERLFRLL